MEKILDLLLELAQKQVHSQSEGWYIGQVMPTNKWLDSFSAQIDELRKQEALRATTFSYNAFSEALTRKREDARLSLRDLADVIGISPSTLSRLERGEHPDLLTYAKLCAWLEVNMNQFFH